MADRKPTVQRGATPASRSAVPATRQSSVPAKYELRQVEFVESENAVAPEFDVDMKREGFTEAPSSLTPTANWTVPGEMLEGVYLGMQENIGPNNSRLYNFRMEDGATVSVWGATVLDNRMDLLRPPVGSIVRIIYVGEAPKKPGQNAARLFKLGFKSA